MNTTGSILFLVLFLVASFTAMITAFTVSAKKIWISVVFCILSGISIGIYSASVQPGLKKGVIIGAILAVLMIPGVRFTRYHREKARARLNEKGLDFGDPFKKR